MDFDELIERVNQIDQDFEKFKKEKSICMESLKQYYWEIHLKNASDNAREFISGNKIMTSKLGITFSHNDPKYLSNVKLRALRSEVSLELFILVAKIIGKRSHIEEELENFQKKISNK